MASVPAEPGKCHGAGCSPALPTVPMHHRQAFAENVNAGKRPCVEDAGAALALKKCQSEQHDHARAKLERVLNEFLGKRERWIGEDALAAFRQLLLQQEIAPVKTSRIAVVDEIAGKDLVTMRAENVDYGTAPTRWLPNPFWQLFHLQERERGAWRGLIEIVAPISQPRATDAGAKRDHGAGAL